MPLLNQTILLWQVLLGSVFLGQRYSPVQLFGILLVVAGVAKAAWPSGAGGSILGQVRVFASMIPVKSLASLLVRGYIGLKCSPNLFSPYRLVGRYCVG